MVIAYGHDGIGGFFVQLIVDSLGGRGLDEAESYAGIGADGPDHIWCDAGGFAVFLVFKRRPILFIIDLHHRLGSQIGLFLRGIALILCLGTAKDLLIDIGVEVRIVQKQLCHGLIEIPLQFGCLF